MNKAMISPVVQNFRIILQNLLQVLEFHAKLDSTYLCKNNKHAENTNRKLEKNHASVITRDYLFKLKSNK